MNRTLTQLTGRDVLPAYTDEHLASLTPGGLIELIVRDEDRVPRNVIDACADRGAAMVEHLSSLIERDPFWRDSGSRGDWWLAVHAAMILGLIPGEEAGLALAGLMRRMAAADDHDQQSWLAAYWPALFANKPDAALAGVAALAVALDMDWYIRASAIEPIVAAAERRDGRSLDEALDWVAGIVADEDEDWDLRLNAGNLLLDFCRARHRVLLQDLARRQGKFGAHFSEQDVRQAYAAGGCEPEWRRFTDPWNFYAPPTIARRQQRWADEADEEDPRDGIEVPMPHVRPTPKVGRNDPCPCGSEKKYKRCCLPGVPASG
jgi:hypothetical protein